MSMRVSMLSVVDEGTTTVEHDALLIVDNSVGASSDPLAVTTHVPLVGDVAKAYALSNEAAKGSKWRNILVHAS